MDMWSCGVRDILHNLIEFCDRYELTKEEEEEIEETGEDISKENQIFVFFPPMLGILNPLDCDLKSITLDNLRIVWVQIQCLINTLRAPQESLKAGYITDSMAKKVLEDFEHYADMLEQNMLEISNFQCTRVRVDGLKFDILEGHGGFVQRVWSHSTEIPI